MDVCSTSKAHTSLRRKTVNKYAFTTMAMVSICPLAKVLHVVERRSDVQHVTSYGRHWHGLSDLGPSFDKRFKGL